MTPWAISSSSAFTFLTSPPGCFEKDLYKHRCDHDPSFLWLPFALQKNLRFVFNSWWPKSLYVWDGNHEFSGLRAEQIKWNFSKALGSLIEGRFASAWLMWKRLTTSDSPLSLFISYYDYIKIKNILLVIPPCPPHPPPHATPILYYSMTLVALWGGLLLQHQCQGQLPTPDLREPEGPSSPCFGPLHWTLHHLPGDSARRDCPGSHPPKNQPPCSSNFKEC